MTKPKPIPRASDMPLADGEIMPVAAFPHLPEPGPVWRCIVSAVLSGAVLIFTLVAVWKHPPSDTA